MPYLILHADNHGYKIFRFVADISIGRHPSSDILLASIEDKTISRCHAKIQRDTKGYLLQDCSLNGTRMNNELIKAHRMRHGDQFEISGHLFTFIEDAAVEPISESRPVQSLNSTVEPPLGETEEVVRCDRVGDDIPDTELKSRLKRMGIVVEDEQMLALYRDVREISRINVPVLILGEPGTGKEKVAQALHEFSMAAGQFVAVNCSAIPEGIFENELFGSVKGAFSDAATKPGMLELADNGTLFLDEIGDMSLVCQPKLLRFLETRSISRLGETRIRELNLRIVAATNQDLTSMIKSETFRPDLFQRLTCIRLRIPPLRERKQDILPLTEFFLADYARKYDLKPLKISKRAAQMMGTYYWPGNVRELANIILNVTVRTRTDTIGVEHLNAASEEMEAFGSGLDTGFPSLNDIEKSHIQKALEQTSDNKSKASELLGISRDTLYKKIQKYKIRKHRPIRS
jgi:transcriptional regulator with PAS, ATPase and Fis domain